MGCFTWLIDESVHMMLGLDRSDSEKTCVVPRFQKVQARAAFEICKEFVGWCFVGARCVLTAGLGLKCT